MYEASGQWSTTHSQPSALTDWWERREAGRGRGGRGSGGCILTIPRSILSSLNLPPFLPSLYPIYPFSYSLLLHPSNPSPAFCLLVLSSIHPSLLPPMPPAPPSPPFPPSAMWHSQVYPRASGPETRCEEKWYLEASGEWAAGCALGQGAWPGLSRLSNPPVRGEAQGVSQGRGVRQWGDRRRRSTGATCPLKQTTSYTFSLRTSFVCLSFLSPLWPPRLHSTLQ